MQLIKVIFVSEYMNMWALIKSPVHFIDVAEVIRNMHRVAGDPIRLKCECVFGINSDRCAQSFCLRHF